MSYHYTEKGVGTQTLCDFRSIRQENLSKNNTSKSPQFEVVKTYS